MFNLFAIIGIGGLLLLIGTISVIVWTKPPDADDANNEAYNSAINVNIKKVIGINLTTGSIIGIIMYVCM